MSHAGTTVLPSRGVPIAQPEIVWTVVVAGGSGTRFGAAKQYLTVGGTRIVDRSAATAAAVSHGVVVVVPASDVGRERAQLAPATVVAGGATRSESVRSGLRAVPDDATIICVHDAARPFATADLYRRVVAAVADGTADGAVPGIAVTDTIKVVAPDRSVRATPDRSSLVAVQTPQAFRASALRAAHASGAEGTDDAALVETDGGRVVVVDGEEHNRKITRPADVEWAEAVVASMVTS